MTYNLFGALVFLVIGLVDIMFIQRMVYPQMRKHYEEAKVTGSQGRDPALFMNGIRFFSLIVLPVVGFMLGDTFEAMFG
ncbi:MAG TPA: hypothetical protein VM144_06675 [Aestuariivirga sp.]|nr:hypothetical protein [Aestuariivirga sp.]